MKQRFTALALATVMLLGLAACAKQSQVEPSPSTSAEATGAPTETVEPTAPAVPDKGTPAPADPSEEVPVLRPGDPGYEDPAPTPSQPPIGDPTAPPAEEPSQEPSDAPSTAAPAASEVYAAVAKAAGETTATMDASAVLENFYNLSASDLEDFAFYIPELSANIEEFFIARVKEGKLDDVKAACQSRLDGMKEEGAFYPGTGVYLDSAKIETSGDWIILCVCPDSAGAVKAFLNGIK